ncbi:hypothetical protein [Streptomyces morookaense]|uniref:Uncharacterized protein n=1 Tax=Streptomyces morookaense TaxID=1970 RepID=A0A7Y7B6R8_STRMO|nr:hypothetical protein [Streptomyces morookaense]NVK80061.1 hypothetical protein [Streptomyces morookaense]GHF46044.1 hypothetical protein GCM10010359_55630 [Streptomyces morookaense]
MRGPDAHPGKYPPHPPAEKRAAAAEAAGIDLIEDAAEHLPDLAEAAAKADARKKAAAPYVDRACAELFRHQGWKLDQLGEATNRHPENIRKRIKALTK